MEHKYLLVYISYHHICSLYLFFHTSSVTKLINPSTDRANSLWQLDGDSQPESSRLFKPTLHKLRFLDWYWGISCGHAACSLLSVGFCKYLKHFVYNSTGGLQIHQVPEHPSFPFLLSSLAFPSTKSTATHFLLQSIEFDMFHSSVLMISAMGW